MTSPATSRESETEQSARDRALWCAVIRQALTDATRTIAPSEPNRAHVEQRQARTWFTGAGKDFRDVCYLAGMDPDAVRERAVRLIEEAASAEPVVVRKGRSANIIEFEGKTLTRRQWAAEKGLTFETLASRLRNEWPIDAALNTPTNPARRRRHGRPEARGVGRVSGVHAGTGALPTAQMSA
ncbi:hypothetical protein [Hansschlegelia zhihuaiae]|uniref:Uncharacterized protein n=1 Tax=Hansschlegelia zhihuaiae TaxID=405005 RepID=A0A4Q0M871_9HYPH|nr:hypothetical protein [Hansschlegelia zhihuaiae]RXF69235.1 hypothetical protein EK403_18795 [Hansschlegelia zhihuaiae]